MIDTIYQTVLTVINKENQGYISPTEFNLLLNNVQMEIFRGYFEDFNIDKVKEHRGITTNGYGNLKHNQSQMIEQFSEITPPISPVSAGRYNLPTDLYFIEENGVSTTEGRVVEVVEKGGINYLKNSEAKPTEVYPVYEKYPTYIITHPNTLLDLEIRYLRTPKAPKWTYFVLPNGNESYDPSNPSFQDVELHVSEFSNIVVRLLAYFGITIREEEVIRIAETMKDKNNIKENQ